MSSFLPFLAFLLGLIFGSFLNVVIYRLPKAIEGKILSNLSFPASHCPACQTPLQLWHNIPLLSYVLLNGRCRFCQSPIPRQYPLVELTNALLWTLCAWHWNALPTAFAWAICMSCLLALSVTDWQTAYLPDALTQPLLWLGLLASSLGWLDISVQHALWGALAGYASLWLVSTVFQQLTGKVGMGAGDFKLLAALGAWLGPLELIPLVLLASMIGALVGIWMQFTKRLNRDRCIPFGPFLASAGAVNALLDGLMWILELVKIN